MSSDNATAMQRTLTAPSTNLFLCWKNSTSGKADGVEDGLNLSRRAFLGVYMKSLSVVWGTAVLPACTTRFRFCNPLESRGSYSATSNNMKLVHWPLMGGLLHLVQRGDWVGPQPAQAPPRCTKCNSHPSTASVLITILLYNGPFALRF